MSQSTIVTGVNIPGIDGHLTLSHAAIGLSVTPSNEGVKEVNPGDLGGLVLDNISNQVEGTTISILFVDSNAIFNNELKLQIGDGPEVRIISSILDPGVSGGKGTSFSYPCQSAGSVVFFVYRIIPEVYTQHSGGGGTSISNNVPVQMAINVPQVPVIAAPLDGDFNNYIYNGIYPIRNFNDSVISHSFTNSDESGILKVERVGHLPINDQDIDPATGLLQGDFIHQTATAFLHTYDRFGFYKITNFSTLTGEWIFDNQRQVSGGN